MLAPGVTHRVENFERRKFKGDRLVWEVRAADAEYKEDEKEATVREVFAQWILGDGRTLAVRSSKGTLRLSPDYRDVDELQLHGEVRLSLDNYELRVEDAAYQRAAQRIVAPGKVRFTGPGVEVEGEGLTVDVERETVQLAGRPRMVWTPRQLKQEVQHDPS